MGEEDPTFLPFKTEDEKYYSDQDDDDDDDDDESSEDSDEDITTLGNGDSNEDSFDVKASEVPSLYDDSYRQEMTEHDEMTESKDDEIERIGGACKRKLEADEENDGVKRQKSVEDVVRGYDLDCDLNNSLETGYTSELYSDLEDDIASY